MAALHARDPQASNAQPAFAPPVAEPAPGLPWTPTDGAPSGDGARGLQTQLKADLYTGRLEQTDRPAAYAPARGILIALVPSALLWWGVVSAVHVLTQHR